MARRYLGKTIDIHCGGQDLIFPHHENEIAQSECCNGVPFANYWMHNGYINVDNRKMSKSLNNFFTVRDVAERYGYEPIRYLMVASHYRTPINYSEEVIEQCRAALERLYNCRDNLQFLLEHGYHIPKDISVIGFDDMPFCEIASPPLTTIKVFKQEMGALAVRRLVSIIKSGNNIKTKTQICTEFVERESTRRLFANEKEIL